MFKRSVLNGSFVTTNLQYTSAEYESLKEMNVRAKQLEAWQRDKTFAQIALSSFHESVEDVSVNLSELRHEEDEATLSGIVKRIRSVQAHPGVLTGDVYDQNISADTRVEANEVLDENMDPFVIKPHSISNLWVEFDIPASAMSGCYSGKLSVSATNLAEPLVFTINLQVINLALSTEDQAVFGVEFWQNPYAVAEYYEVEAFSPEHLDILEGHLELYRSIGGNTVVATITEEAWNGQTFSKHDIKFPSMVKWLQRSNGTFEYDYTQFNQWISFTRSLGLGDKIVCYSILPWNQRIIYYDAITGTREEVAFEVGDERYYSIWDHFLRSFMRHTEALKIKDSIYLGIDERGFVAEILEFTQRITGSDGKAFKIAGAIDHLEQHEAVVLELDFLSVGSVAVKAQPDVFEKVRAERNALGKETYLYSCTGHAPGNFSLSAPGESYWTILFAYAQGTTGFLRWAYDSWVENPLEDATHESFETGDCFLIYPGERHTSQPKPKSSTRFEKIAEGIRDVTKLIYLKQHYPSLENELKELIKGVQPIYPTSGYYLTQVGKEQLDVAMIEFKRRLHQLSYAASQQIQRKHSLMYKKTR